MEEKWMSEVNWSNVTEEWWGSENGTLQPEPAVGGGLAMKPREALATAAYLVGVAGNSLALCFLLSKKQRNARHSVLLVSLGINDLTAVSGMWALLIARMARPAIASTRLYCLLRVVLRVFGLGSGSIVIVMAVERWFALTRPFFYQKYITLGTVKRSIAVLWLAVLVLVCLPLVGIGAYYEDGRCVRYKLARRPLDRAYAWLYLTYGSLLCLCIVCCNIAVMRALVHSRRRKGPGVLVRRISRNKDLSPSSCTSEELAFARVMALLCALFVLCWLPQMVSIPVCQMMQSFTPSSVLNLPDLLMALHFCIDPYFYVLQRWSVFTRLLCRSSSFRSHSTKTTQELITT